MKVFFPFLFAASVVAISRADEGAFTKAQIEHFEKEVRPLLVERCHGCHGAEAHQNGLRLDSRAAVLRGSDYGPVAVVGNADASKLIQAVRGEKGAEKMPKKGEALTSEQIAQLSRWINEGLPWPDEAAAAEVAHSRADPKEHWAFRPVVKPAVPAGRHPIDALTEVRLKAAGLARAEPAAAAVLCRRIHLTLTGLQPSFAELQAFEKAVSVNRDKAIGDCVDRLLASPRYGERWARHWLDVARYADSEGYTVAGKDNRFPYAYTYRNWVVNAFNDDMPYDVFVKRQLAADKMLPEVERAALAKPEAAAADRKHLAALGFLTVNDRFISDTVLQTDDRIDVVTRGVLGLTVGCARCHDHKFDPIPTQDYYSLYSVFQSSMALPDDEMPVIGTAADPAAAADYQKKRSEIEGKMDAFRAEVLAEMKKPERLGEYLLFSWQHRDADRTALAGLAGKASLRDRVADKWRSFFKVTAAPDKKHPVMLPWMQLAALKTEDFAANAEKLMEALPKDPKVCNPIVVKALREKKPKTMAEVAAVYGHLFTAHQQTAELDDAQAESIRRMLMSGASPMSVEIAGADTFFTRKDQAVMVKHRNELKQLELSSDGAPPKAMVMVDKPKPSDTTIMIRGNPGRRGELAPRGYLTFFGGEKFTDGSGRLELAERMVRDDNPLTARVMVNRVWMQHFGRPLVSEPSDFGVQTPAPVQPELLDYLASFFMENGWSVKKIQRLILTSQTYQQCSATTPAKLEKDADNELLSRMNRQRLDYEGLRDNLLLVTGALKPEAGMPPRPVSMEDAQADQWRSVALLVDRYNQAAVPAMFDFANPDSHSSQRFVTTVPQQALFLMNSHFMKRHSEGLAKGLPVRGSQPDGETVKALFQKVLLRDPTAEEVSQSLRFLAESETVDETPGFLWKYGTMRLEKAEGAAARAVDWQAFSVLDERKRWSHTGKIPDPKWSYAYLDPTAGHPGSGDRLTVAQWTAPADMTMRGEVSVELPQEQSDGIFAGVWSQRAGWLAQKEMKPKEKATLKVTGHSVKKGETLELVFGCKESPSFDSLRWNAKLYQQETLLTDSTADFCGKDGWPLSGRARPQPTLAQLAQVLLMSNEFQFID